MKRLVIILIIGCSFSLQAQIAFEPFAEIRLVGELHAKCIKKGNLSNLRLVGNLGIKSYILRLGTNETERVKAKSDFFVAPNISANLLLGRGIGASIRQNIYEIRNQVSISGIVGMEWGGAEYNRKLDFQTNSLSGGIPSNRNYIIGLSSNWVQVSSERNRQGLLKYQQRVGGFFAAFKCLSMAYTNDGPPFGSFGFGDKGDRMFTGYGQVAYTKKDLTNPTVYKITYERYTGWEENAYEIANDAKLDFVEYKNNYTTGFTRGQYRFGVQNNHIQGGITLNDFDNLDFQNLIHLARSFSLHRTPVKGSVSLWGGLTKNLLP